MIRSFAFIGLAIAAMLSTNRFTGESETINVYEKQPRTFGNLNQRQRRKRERQTPQRRK